MSEEPDPEADLKARVAGYLAQMGGMPIAAAADGNVDALLELAGQVARAGMDPANGMVPEPRWGTLISAMILARMAAARGPKGMTMLTTVLLGIVSLSADSDLKMLTMAEALVWMDRAAQAGEATCDDVLQRMSGGPLPPEVLRAAAIMEKVMHPDAPA